MPSFQNKHSFPTTALTFGALSSTTSHNLWYGSASYTRMNGYVLTWQEKASSPSPPSDPSSTLTLHAPPPPAPQPLEEANDSTSIERTDSARGLPQLLLAGSGLSGLVFCLRLRGGVSREVLPSTRPAGLLWVVLLFMLLLLVCLLEGLRVSHGGRVTLCQWLRTWMKNRRGLCKEERQGKQHPRGLGRI